MNLPPSLQAIADRHDSNPALVWEIAHEACRLQRGWCVEHFRNKGDDIENTLLVVPNPEET